MSTKGQVDAGVMQTRETRAGRPSIAVAGFEGPLDLLLHLVTRHRVDIYDIPLATVTRDYLEALSALPAVDLESATEFLVVAAALLELKSARLLPTSGPGAEDVDLLEERDLLLSRLVESATYQEAGRAIGARLAQGEAFLARPAWLDPAPQPPPSDLLAGIAPTDLAAAAATALASNPRGEVDTSHLDPIQASVRAAVVELARALNAMGEASFESLCRQARGRIDVVVRFLALLELFKAGAVDLHQAVRFGDIRAAWTGRASVEEVAEGVEEYAASDASQGS